MRAAPWWKQIWLSAGLVSAFLPSSPFFALPKLAEHEASAQHVRWLHFRLNLAIVAVVKEHEFLIEWDKATAAMKQLRSLVSMCGSWIRVANLGKQNEFCKKQIQGVESSCLGSVHCFC